MTDPADQPAPPSLGAGSPPGRAAPAAASGPSVDRPLTTGERIFYRIAQKVLSAFAILYWRATVEGRANIPATGPFVVAPVHRSNIDTPLMGRVTPRHLRYMAKDTLWRYRWSARLITALGGFPVNRDTADRGALRTCESALRRGEPVVIFPEGTRKSGPVVEDLFQGAAYVALRTGVPIVPVGIGGSSGAMPKGSKFLHPVKVHIVIGAPIEPPVRGESVGRGIRRHVHEMTAQLQSDLQRVFDQAEAGARGGAGPWGP